MSWTKKQTCTAHREIHTFCLRKVTSRGGGVEVWAHVHRRASWRERFVQFAQQTAETAKFCCPPRSRKNMVFVRISFLRPLSPPPSTRVNQLCISKASFIPETLGRTTDHPCLSAWWTCKLSKVRPHVWKILSEMIAAVEQGQAHYEARFLYSRLQSISRVWFNTQPSVLISGFLNIFSHLSVV